MTPPAWEPLLARWRGAGLIDANIAERIRAFETAHPEDEETKSLRWPVLLAVAFGCVMVAAGILLFVAAHWDNLSPGERFTLVLTMVGGFHLAAAFFAERLPNLSTSLHAIGTATLGAGIFLGGQIFNLDEHWPGGIMLWALGAGLAWWLLRDWPQAALFAMLLPAWLAGEWDVRVNDVYHTGGGIVMTGLLALMLTYLTAITRDNDSNVRRSLMWIGGIFFLPFIPSLIWSAWGDAHQPAYAYYGYNWQHPVPLAAEVIGWVVGLGVPLLLAYRLRKQAAWTNALALLWVLGLYWISRWENPEYNLMMYLWCLFGSVGLVYWGLHDMRKERINFGMAIFAFTVMTFYFANLLDKMGRSMMLISLGALFLLGGWMLEKTRRRLVAKIAQVPA